MSSTWTGLPRESDRAQAHLPRRIPDNIGRCLAPSRSDLAASSDSHFAFSPSIPTINSTGWRLLSSAWRP
jgi:hypothetical protein